MYVSVKPLVFVTLSGMKIYMSQSSLDWLAHCRKEAMESWLNCTCLTDESGQAYRVSFFGQQEPTALVAEGEIAPNEISHQLDDLQVELLKTSGQLFHGITDVFDFNTWRSANGGKIECHYIT